MFLAGTISGGVEKTAGNDEGVVLETPNILQSQSTSSYTTDGLSGSTEVARTCLMASISAANGTTATASRG